MITLRTTDVTRKILERHTIGYPFMFTSINPRLSRLLDEAGFLRCNLNLVLSKELLEIPKQDRALFIPKRIRKVAEEKGNAICFENISMLMNPSYELDVIKLFCELARTHRIAFVWPGSAESGVLVYSNPAEADYKHYHLANYDVMFIR
jgi:hypothetical protein